MFRAWQVFIFSLVPLSLIFIGVIGGSFHGKDSRTEAFNPPPAAGSPGGSPGTPGLTGTPVRTPTPAR